MKIANRAAVALGLMLTGPIALGQAEFDAGHSIALDGEITNGVVITDSDDPTRAEAQVREQLRYAIGQLNGLGGGIDSSRITVTLGQVTANPDGLWTYTYSAKALVSWPREFNIPTTYTLLLPARGDYQGRAMFVDLFGSDENSGKRCLASDAYAISTGNFWYYYRPFNQRCQVARSNSDLLTRIPMHFSISSVNTTGKSPEYGKVWEDGQLVATYVVSMYEPGGGNQDAGVHSYAALYWQLLRSFGAPESTSLPDGANPSLEFPEIRATFRSSRGPVDVALFLVDTPPSAGYEFRRAYAERTKTSDFVSYNGHAGLGANVRSLVDMGEYTQGQYQIFMFNGCDTFSYIDDQLGLDHQRVNPDHAPTKFVDVVTTARPAMFQQMADSSMAFTRALVDTRKTYREILLQVDPSQRSAVTGEEDNMWPNPF